MYGPIVNSASLHCHRLRFKTHSIAIISSIYELFSVTFDALSLGLACWRKAHTRKREWLPDCILHVCVCTTNDYRAVPAEFMTILLRAVRANDDLIGTWVSASVCAHLLVVSIDTRTAVDLLSMFEIAIPALLIPVVLLFRISDFSYLCEFCVSVRSIEISIGNPNNISKFWRMGHHNASRQHQQHCIAM